MNLTQIIPDKLPTFVPPNMTTGNDVNFCELKLRILF